MAAPTVLILAAGQGTRMRSSTPKVLHELCGIPMLLWPVRAAQAAGAARVVVVDSPALALQKVLPDGVELVVQPKSDGTGGATRAAAELIDPASPVVILSGDVPLVSAQAIEKLVQAHASSGAAATMATALLDDPSGYGRVVRDSDGSVARVVETKKPGDATEAELRIHEVNSGIYVFNGSALLKTLPRLTSDNAQGELYLPQALDLLRSDGESIAAHVVEDEGLMLGVNDRVALAQVRALAQQAIAERHMRAGVTIVDPPSTVIDIDVQIGQDTLIEPGTALKGSTIVGAGAVVGPSTTAIDSQIGDGAYVRVSWLSEAVLHPGVTVGPFAYLRPGAVLRDGAKAGTFVEIKNSDIGENAKVPHLSYIGDADVGARTNLGAGTITANYDGHAKHRTTIGSGVRGGVDTSFVAPVTVGDDAYTAAGSVITGDVPPGALAVARARQENLEGYAGRREEQDA
ncbi:MAG TPA: bifunctional UDP-N-acetylglucosamine diphosphorylase/glucosamine-1-phosphate N-acetyltransferase GlmU [Solirubrobacteraceae bacterium]|jgi:bifunctional UDP-N-acetylglucosamine pyrophosphorylase/glucosamine-1-phosphate N-acetyltransferase|nr:bifunctional UDP-N-acetylglucosamine diphosphorylase/glucosamine-1-phosphate N-acetyltransferase GlmU [Solirubrobacteraceae bacterium]